MLETIAREGSFAAAARRLGLVPSALTYRVRALEEALDVLLFDRRSRQARPTPAGQELLRTGALLLNELDAVAQRVRRVATGWEPQLTVAVSTLLAPNVVMDLSADFLALVGPQGPPTRLRLRDETLSGTLEALTSGQADLALGLSFDPGTHTDIHSLPLGSMKLVYAVAPQHPLASAPEPLSDEMIAQHRAVAVADTTQRGTAMTVGVLGGQDVFTVASSVAKLRAQLRGLGTGFLPEAVARPYIEAGRLVVKAVARAERIAPLRYAWRAHPKAPMGRALQWWLDQLQRATTRSALLTRHEGV